MNKLKSLLNEIIKTFNLKLIQHTGTLYKQAEEALFESDGYIRCPIEYANDLAIYLFDTDGYGASWKHAVEHLKVLTSEENTGQFFTLFYYEKFIREAKYQIMRKK